MKREIMIFIRKIKYLIILLRLKYVKICKINVRTFFISKSLNGFFLSKTSLFIKMHMSDTLKYSNLSNL